jgi:hypothetical protein
MYIYIFKPTGLTHLPVLLRGQFKGIGEWKSVQQGSQMKIVIICKQRDFQQLLEVSLFFE